MHVKAAVEQPIFVTPLAAITKRAAPALTAQPIDRSAISKLATALREQPAALHVRRARRDPGDPDRRSAPALRRRSRRFRQGRYRDRARVLRQRGGGRRRPRAGRARRHVRSGDARPSRRRGASRAMRRRPATITPARWPPARRVRRSGWRPWRRNSATFGQTSRLRATCTWVEPRSSSRAKRSNPGERSAPSDSWIVASHRSSR